MTGPHAAAARLAGRRVRVPPRRRPKGQVKADINVTPLVDVVLVLLIIFMVVTPMIARGVNVDLPVTVNHDRKNDDNRDIIVSIDRQVAVYVGADKVPIERLTAAIAEERRRHPGKGVFIKADQRIDYGQARRAMEAARAAGADDVQLGTEEARK
jgi:biopolymer transport protein TolR